jgi:hypothetical protein
MSKFFKRLLSKKQKPKQDIEFQPEQPKSLKKQLFFDQKGNLHNFSELVEEDPQVIGVRQHNGENLWVLNVKLPVVTVKFAFHDKKKPTRKSPSKKKHAVKKSATKTRRSPKRGNRVTYKYC